MKGIINAFTFIIDFFKTVFGFVMDIFSTIGMVFRYLITIADIAFEVIKTFPDWLKAFALVTMSISIAYFIIGRDTGKSD